MGLFNAGLYVRPTHFVRTRTVVHVPRGNIYTPVPLGDVAEQTQIIVAQGLVFITQLVWNSLCQIWGGGGQFPNCLYSRVFLSALGEI